MAASVGEKEIDRSIQLHRNIEAPGFYASKFSFHVELMSASNGTRRTERPRPYFSPYQRSTCPTGTATKFRSSEKRRQTTRKALEKSKWKWPGHWRNQMCLMESSETEAREVKKPREEDPGTVFWAKRADEVTF